MKVMFGGNIEVYFAPIDLETGKSIGNLIKVKQKRSAKHLSYGRVKYKVEFV